MKTTIVCLSALFLITPHILHAQILDAEKPALVSVRSDGTDLQVVYQFEDFDHAAAPAVSTLGKTFISAWSEEEGESDRTARIYDVNVTTKTLSVIEPGIGVSFSPRGRRIATTRFSPGRGVWVTKLRQKESVILDRRGRQARWSPNGRRIAYVKTIGERSTIAVYDMVEDDYFELWENSNSPYAKIVGQFDWSPDSRRLCLRVRRPLKNDEIESDVLSELITVSVAASPELTVHQKSVDGQFPSLAWHRDGTSIVFSQLDDLSGQIQLFEFDPASGEKAHRFPGLDTTRDNSSPCWSVSGNRLLFVSSPTETDDNAD